MSCKGRKVLRSREFWSQIHLLKQKIAKAMLSSVISNDDPRPYAKIHIGGLELLGLLDSGASISCLGLNSLVLLSKLGMRYKSIKDNVQTADGAAQEIVGCVDLVVKFNDKENLVKFYIVPSLQQEIYLGIDFWFTFGLAPLKINEIVCQSTEQTVDTNVHILSEEHNAALDSVKAKFPSFSEEGLGKTDVLSHKIDVGSSEPFKKRHYPVSPPIQKLMYEEIDRMLSLGVIEESSSAYSSPIVLVRKGNGKARLCLDSRTLNAVTVKNAFPMPNIEGIIGRLEVTRFISSIYLKDAFWQIPLEETSKEKTAFAVPGRPLYQFTRMPFGLCNAAQTMCRLMDRVIPNELRDSVFVFIDDLLVVSIDFETHLAQLEIVAHYLRKANLTINIEKSKFVMKEVKYLGYIVGDGCIKTDPDKIRSIVDFSPPKSVKHVRRFLGMCGWYKQFIWSYSDVSAPIWNLLKKSDKFSWTEEAQVAFEKLKQCLITAPVLANPDFTKPFVLQCDSSQTGVGCVLYQIGSDGEEHPIAYMSQKLNSAQRNYSVTELECLAAVLAVKKFRAYIEGAQFKIVTDHASLK